jgi:DNA ligase-1
MSTDPNFIPLEDAKTHLPRGKHTEVWGSGAKPYKLQHHLDGAYSCSCPAWRNQSAPGLVRTCKHLKQLRGFGKEDERLNATDMDRFALALEDLPVPAQTEDVSPAHAAPAAPKALAPEPEDPYPESFKPVLLAEKWDPSVDPTGYYMSEKLDGVRAYWDGDDFYSRNGNLFESPPALRRSMPRGVHIDGELYAGPGKFNETVSIVRSGVADPSRWQNVRYMAFDLPEHPGLFEDRMAALEQVAMRSSFTALKQTLCTSPQHLKQFHDNVKARGIEGTMLREAGSSYERRRSRTLLKVKDFLDTEARIVGYVPGAGKHKGRLGAYEAQLSDGTRFSVGTGLSDKERSRPLPVGTIIVVRYQELTPAGVPRFPSYIGVRAD